MTARKKQLLKNYGFVLVLLPSVIALVTFSYIISGGYTDVVSRAGAQRLITDNWESAYDILTAEQPSDGRKFAYYQVKEGQTVQEVADHFSVSADELQTQNPGPIIPGVTVRIKPVQGPLAPSSSNGLITSAKIIEDGEFIRVRGDFENQTIVTTLPELANYLSSYGTIEQTGEKTWRILKPLSIEENIRIDITDQTVEKLELRSDPNDIVCLCFENAQALIRNTEITTYTSTNGAPDFDHADERSYVRARKSTRMDVINSTISYLGNSLIKNNDKQIQSGGGVYGISWRIPDDRLGKDIATGWVENNLFYKNHFGSYSFGASGMVWTNNHYLENDVYGLDPHDDSNNALVQGNLFERNGKHGFIVSKRCNYNVIRDNVSRDNGLHGFMLHQNSSYNVIENNISINNVDNYVIYDSDSNIIRNNQGFDAGSAHVRINAESKNNYVLDNQFVQGRYGVHAYGNSSNILIEGNVFESLTDIVKTNTVNSLVFIDNRVEGLNFDFSASTNVIFGPNTIKPPRS